MQGKILGTMATEFVLPRGSKRDRPFTVIIEGNIGSGKTTFLNHFKKFESVCLLSEPVELWRNCAGHNLLVKCL